MALSDLRAMLVTAGLGTRLAPLTDRLPKPAVPVANRPVAWFALEHLRHAGIRDVVLNTHHLARELTESVSAAASPELSLRFVYEPELLGTGGGIHNAWQPRDGETFVVMNGKLLFAPNLDAALRVHLESDAIATMIVKEVPAGDRLGAVEIDAANRVRRLLGQPASAPGPLRTTMYASVCLLAARAHRDLPERGCLIRDAYRHWIDRGERVMAYVETASFRDVGMSHWHYWEANMALLSGAELWPGIDPDASGNLIDPSVQLGNGVVLEQTAVGAGAKIAAGVSLKQCVVWPGASVDASHQAAIVLPDARVVAIVR